MLKTSTKLKSNFWMFSLVVGLVHSGCGPEKFRIKVLNTEIEVAAEDAPIDQGTIRRRLNLPVPDVEQMARKSSDPESVALVAANTEGKLMRSYSDGLEYVRTGSLRQLLIDLENFNNILRARNIKLVEMVLEAHKNRWEAKVSELKAERSAVMAEYHALVAKQSEEMADAKMEASMAGAAILGLLTGGIGALIGGVGGWSAAESQREEIPVPVVPTDDEIKTQAAEHTGLGKDPETGLHQLKTRLKTQLMDAEVGSTEVMLSSFEILLRRATFTADDGLRLAQMAQKAYADASAVFASAGNIWKKSDEDYQLAKETYARATQNFQRAQRAILLSVVVTGLIQAYTDASAMSTGQYRDKLKNMGMDLDGYDIDHIFPKSTGGPNHAWNYQVVPAALNRAWSNGHLFEKCLMNPVGFAKAALISHPAVTGTSVGILAYSKLQAKTISTTR